MLNLAHTKNEQKQEKNGDKNGKTLYKLINYVLYGKTMENLRNRIDLSL